MNDVVVANDVYVVFVDGVVDAVDFAEVVDDEKFADVVVVIDIDYFASWRCWGY